jgi:hypothetical protein
VVPSYSEVQIYKDANKFPMASIVSLRENHTYAQCFVSQNIALTYAIFCSAKDYQSICKLEASEGPDMET